MIRLLPVLLASWAWAAPPKEIAPALEAFSAPSLLERIKVLASDEFEGRAPGSKGEELTLRYIEDEFRKAGAAPGAPGGSYRQPVDLVGLTPSPRASFRAGKLNVRLSGAPEYVAGTQRFSKEVEVEDSDVVFVGYGVVAPEYGWDDYKGVDVAGKTIVMLVGDPPVPDPKDPSKLDDGMFRGRAMTYYGRWSYKYEIAAEKKAAAAVIVHETEAAGYPWEVLSGGFGREGFDIDRPDGNAGRAAVEAWVSSPTASRLFALGGQSYAELKKAAAEKDFRPVPLELKASFEVANKTRKVRSANAVALVEGSDPTLKDQYVVYTAHWDHFGKDPALKGDNIYNGAQDNASGVASLLEMAKAFKALPKPPRRSILFLAVTAEESGLLGAVHYAANPLYPLEKTAAVINMDSMNLWGPTRDIGVIGLGLSTLDETLARAAKGAGRTVSGDPSPEKGFFYRSDHFAFAKKGVPALNYDAGTEFLGKDPAYAARKRDDYISRDYHKPSDEVKPDWDLNGLAGDLRLLFEVGWRVAQEPRMPEWKPGAEFKAIREESLRRAR